MCEDVLSFVFGGSSSPLVFFRTKISFRSSVFLRPLRKPKKMTPKYRNFRLNFEISEISKEEGV